MSQVSDVGVKRERGVKKCHFASDVPFNDTNGPMITDYIKILK